MGAAILFVTDGTLQIKHYESTLLKREQWGYLIELWPKTEEVNKTEEDERVSGVASGDCHWRRNGAMEQSNEQAETSSDVNVNEITTNNVLPKIKVCKLYLFN